MGDVKFLRGLAQLNLGHTFNLTAQAPVSRSPSIFGFIPGWRCVGGSACLCQGSVLHGAVVPSTSNGPNMARFVFWGSESHPHPPQMSVIRQHCHKHLRNQYAGLATPPTRDCSALWGHLLSKHARKKGAFPLTENPEFWGFSDILQPRTGADPSMSKGRVEAVNREPQGDRS